MYRNHIGCKDNLGRANKLRKSVRCLCGRLCNTYRSVSKGGFCQKVQISSAFDGIKLTSPIASVSLSCVLLNSHNLTPSIVEQKSRKNDICETDTEPTTNAAGAANRQRLITQNTIA